MLQPPRLLLITDRSVCPNLEATLTQAIAGGQFDILLRDKTASAESITLTARRLKILLQINGGRLIIHDRTDIALAVEADGVHLPEAGMATVDARRLLKPHQLLGRSCHNSQIARQHLQQGGNYITLSPLFPTQSHPDATPLGLSQFKSMVSSISGPTLALGGVHANNIASVMQTGAYGVALIRGVLDQPDPRSAVHTLLTYISKV